MIAMTFLAIVRRICDPNALGASPILGTLRERLEAKCVSMGGRRRARTACPGRSLVTGATEQHETPVGQG